VSKGSIVLEKKGPVAYITISREEALNALNREIIENLDKIFSQFEKDSDVRVVIITGAGERAFAAGADVREIKEAGKGRTEFIARGQAVFKKIMDSSKVVIAAVNGYALGGGCELALACDIRVASENARFGMPEATIGVMPGYGGTQLLPRLVGRGMAKYMMFAGMMLDAREAYRIGLVEKVCKREELMDEVTQLAKKICSGGPLALKGIKEAVDKGLNLPFVDALRLELEIYDNVANSEDAEEGLSAFLEKRAPVFKGR
jgi:enoyl-CoA hydratase